MAFVNLPVAINARGLKCSIVLWEGEVKMGMWCDLEVVCVTIGERAETLWLYKETIKRVISFI